MSVTKRFHGFVDDAGHVAIVEIKSPIAATHWDYIRTGVIPGEYQKQILHALWITGAAWCDWLSYHPEFPESIRVKLVRVKRDDKAIAEYEQKAIAFLAEVSREYAEIDATRWITPSASRGPHEPRPGDLSRHR